ncbi:MAG: NAD(P)H-dependent oxidoreductase [Lachnospiraceae bacterium]|nr:NAD(P)H-dependent oxidoreductase [Lachnospiraceae bacterium]
MKTLIAYFSAETGRTRKAAQAIAKLTGGELFEIKPQEEYTPSDLNWKNPLARCNKEKMGKKDVPVAEKVEDFDSYDTVCLGFPIWYWSAPNVVNTFCKDYDWTGKKVYIFATSGGSNIGKTAEKLMPYVEGAEIVHAEVLKNTEGLKEWVKKIG